MIPVFEPQVGEEEIAAVASAIRRGEISGSYGETIPIFEKKFAEYSQCRHGVAVTSGTTALHLAFAAAGIQPGDEVLVSAVTNIASALAVYHHGAITVPVDVEPDTWNLDLDRLESLITPRTRAILPVHLYGHPVDMESLMAIARRHGLVVIEDAAEAHGALCRGRKAGSFGDMACFSFYANKILTTGEGGMVTTNDDRLAERLRLLRNLGFTEPRFRHEVAGFNFRMTGFQAAMGIVQTEKIEKTIAGKRRIAQAYRERLVRVPGIRLPVEKQWARNVYWMYAIVLEKEFGVDRDTLARMLAGAGIETRTFFCPMNQQPFLRAQPGFRDSVCPIADSLWRQGLYLPSSVSLTEFQVETIAREIEGAPKMRNRLAA